MPINVNAAKTQVDFVKNNAAKTEADFVKVNAAKTIAYQKSDPLFFTYDCIDSQTYDGTNANNSSNRDILAYEGQSGTHGNEGSMFLFNDAQIRADLATRPTILSVTFRLSCRWSFAGAGKSFNLAAQNFNPLPNSGAVWGPTLAFEFFTRGQIRTIAMPNSLGEDLRDNVVKGMGLRYVQTDWGYCAGIWTTNVLVASPTGGQLELSGDGEIPRLIIEADF